MSSFVVNDVTAMAIAVGMVRTGRRTHCRQSLRDAVRDVLNLNQAMTGLRYSESYPKVTDGDAHAIVGAFFDGDELTREFSDAEVVGCCRCWQYQCDESADIEENRLYIEVGEVADDLVARQVEAGEWKELTYLNHPQIYAKTVYQCGDERVTEYDRPVEFPWGLED